MTAHLLRSCLRLAGLALLGFAVPGTAAAHPHVWTEVNSVLVYDDEGRLEAIRHAWRFDEMFSAFATQGLDVDGDGVLSREELADLAEVNVTSLSEFDFFTFARAGSGTVRFDAPRDYWLEHDGTSLTLHFTLPAAAPEAARPLSVEIYDPTIFVDFRLAKDTPVTLDNAPAGCAVHIEVAKDDIELDAFATLSEDFFDQLEAGNSFAQQFANVIAVRCPGDPALAGRRAPPEPVMPPESDADMAAGPGADAQTGPFGSGRGLGAFGLMRPDGASSAPGGGISGWIAARQAGFYRTMSETLSVLREGGSGGWLLVALAFAYGVFHAAGPGHGKFVIASYLVATGQTLRRGVAISFASALAQAATAVAMVLVLAFAFGATSQALGIAAYWLEAASYAVIALMGGVILWRTGRKLLAAWRGQPVHDHLCGPECGHGHMPGPEALSGEFGWRRALAVVLAIGLRPCTGAILVLVFALANGLLWAGVAATFAMALGTALTVSLIAVFAVVAKSAALRLASGGGGVLAVRFLEATAGTAILLFGALLLAGLMAQGGLAGL